MRYCTHCQKLFDEASCPDCQSLGRTPRPEDWCQTAEQPKMFAQMLADVLEQNGIPSAFTSTQGGTGIFSNMNMEIYRVFVPYSFLDRASLLADELFSPESIAEGEDPPEEEGEEEQEREEP